MPKNLTSLSNASDILNAGTNVTKALLNNKAERLGNAQNPDYTKKDPLLKLSSSNGSYSSVSVGKFVRSVDPVVRQKRFESIGNLSFAEIKSEFGDKLSALLGRFNDDKSFSNRITGVLNAIDNLVASPTNAQNPSALKDAALELTEMINSVSDGIQKLRTECEQELSSSVNKVNELLGKLYSSNQKLNTGFSIGADVARLMDPHDALVSELADYIPLKVEDNTSGSSYIALPFPVMLRHEQPISFQGGSVITPQQFYNIDGSGILQGVKDAEGNDVTFKLTSGKLGGLFEMRDKVLVNAQNLIDNLTSSLMTEFNAISNKGTAYTPERILTGDRAIAGGDGDAFTGQGTLRVALIDHTTHIITAHQDIDLSAINTIGDMRNAFQTVAGIATAYDVDGHLVLNSGDDNLGIAMVAIGDAHETVSGKNLGISHYFGFNNLFTAKGFTPEGTKLGVSNMVMLTDKLKTKPQLFTLGTLTKDAVVDGTTMGPSVGDVSNAGLYVLPADKNSEGVEPLRTRSVMFSATGSLVATSQTFDSYAAVISGTIGDMSKSLNDELTTQTQRREDIQSLYDDISKVKPEEEFLSLPDLTILMNFMMSAQSMVLEAKRSILQLTH